MTFRHLRWAFARVILTTNFPRLRRSKKFSHMRAKILEKKYYVIFGWPPPVLFFLPEKMKSARENGFGYFFWFFSRAEMVFLAHFVKIFLGQFEILSGTFSNFFSGWFFFFLGQKIKNFLGHIFIFSGRIFQWALNFSRVNCRYTGIFLKNFNE